MSELNKQEKYFIEMMETIANEGYVDENPRPKYASDGVSAHSISIHQFVMKYDLSKGEFPFSELRSQAWKTGIREMQAFYQEQTNDLDIMEEKYKLSWWRDWQVEGTNHHGQRYGHTVKRYDLMNKLLDGIKNDPFGRRHILNLWQEEEFQDDPDSLKPCAFLSMYSVRKMKDGLYLDATLIQRSSNFLVAGFINQSQYVALQMMIAKHVGMKVGTFMHVVQNLHIYDRELEQGQELLNRIEILKQRGIQSRPQLKLNVPDFTNFYSITIDDFELVDYNPIKEPLKKFDLAI